MSGREPSPILTVRATDQPGGEANTREWWTNLDVASLLFVRSSEPLSQSRNRDNMIFHGRTAELGGPTMARFPAH